MRIKRFVKIALVCGMITFASTGGPMFGQEEGKQKSTAASQLELADLNSDGTVTTEELKLVLQERYLDAWANKIDANQNGKISKWELRLARKALEQLFVEESNAASSALKAARKNMKPMTAVDQMNASFMNRKPMIGATVDSLIAFDEAGEEVDFKDFRGKHVVVVFGCLT